MRHLLLAFYVMVVSGCGNLLEFDPNTTVILKVTGVKDDAHSDQIKDECVELVRDKSAWQKHQIYSTGDRMTIKISPVDDVDQYAEKIRFGEVTSVDGNTIHVKVGGPDAKMEPK